MAGFHVEHFGCRSARADGEAIRAQLRAAGLDDASAPLADLVIVNTCSVTAEADRQARAYIRRARRQNPDAKVVVTGCYAQRAPEEVADLEGVSAVIGNSHKALAPAILLDLVTPTPSAAFVAVADLLAPGTGPSPQKIWADDQFAHSFLAEAPLVSGQQTRPNLKIQEGCSNHCSFCIIPRTRGRSRSLAAADVLAQVQGFVASGGQELVLSGINLGRWGRDLDSNQSLAALVERLLAETSLSRLRLSSIEPMDWTPELVSVLARHAAPSLVVPRLARHLHLPLQSGSDAVLRRMFRRYRPWHYRQKVEELVRAAGPDLTIGADVLVGFPAETDAEFRETVELIESLPLTYLHLFPFSPRPGTPAWQLHAQSPVSPELVRERRQHLSQLADQKALAHRRRFLGRTLSVLTLNTAPELQAVGRTEAISDNFLPVQIAGLHPPNQLLTVTVESVDSLASGHLHATIHAIANQSA